MTPYHFSTGLIVEIGRFRLQLSVLRKRYPSLVELNKQRIRVVMLLGLRPRGPYAPLLLLLMLLLFGAASRVFVCCLVDNKVSCCLLYICNITLDAVKCKSLG